MERHRDNIGVLRLLFASLVIVGHAPEMVDGDRHREPLTMIFHTLSLGELSVDAFFLLSGYLITMSWLKTNSLRIYIERRILRIYPAFAVAFIMSVLVMGPFVGADPRNGIAGAAVRLVTLQPPGDYPGQLVGLHYPLLNGAMWTIAFEFRCYLAVAALGLAGLLANRLFMFAATMAMLAMTTVVTFHAVGDPMSVFASHHLRLSSVVSNPGQPLAVFRLSAAFLVGACFYLFRETMLAALGPYLAGLCAFVTVVLLFHDPHFGEVALITFGAAALFWLAFKANIGPLQRINDRWDISYGVYLYGWPIATTIRWFDRGVSPWALAAATVPLALIAGTLSWWLVEKWTKDLARSRSRAGASTPATPPVASMAA